jgi:hypothetical protein
MVLAAAVERPVPDTRYLREQAERQEHTAAVALTRIRYENKVER